MILGARQRSESVTNGGFGFDLPEPAREERILR
jgi:hypothetical protein